MRASNDLKSVISRKTSASDAPMAAHIEKNVPVYDCDALQPVLSDAEQETALKAELATILLTGPGVFVLKSAFPDTAAIDEATAIFLDIIEREKQIGSGGSDHFAKAGANDRIWNSLEKLCLAAPEVFARYHGNPWIRIASQAWLGPAFQMTAQVNLVHPGGPAQEGHCDYHLGFMTKEQVETYPPHVHAMSAQLTLQGAIAHCDMPVESGTTKLLTFSQNWPGNYTGFRETDAHELFDEHHIQLPLQKGDLLFFSPGLLHGAGENKTSDIGRMANLLQVSSAFGRAMETIDQTAMCKALYPVLRDGSFSSGELEAVIATAAEGYPFPTNLDRDPPIGGLAPPSQQALMKQALEEAWTAEELSARLDEREAKRLPD